MAADVEVVLLDFFADLAWTTTIADFRKLPTLIDQHGGVLRIRRIGGGSDRDADTPTVSVQAYGKDTQAKPRATFDLASAVEDRLLQVLNGTLPGWVDGVLFEDPEKTSGPVELTSPEPTISIVESIYRLTIRH